MRLAFGDVAERAEGIGGEGVDVEGAALADPPGRVHEVGELHEHPCVAGLLAGCDESRRDEVGWAVFACGGAAAHRAGDDDGPLCGRAEKVEGEGCLFDGVGPLGDHHAVDVVRERDDVPVQSEEVVEVQGRRRDEAQLVREELDTRHPVLDLLPEEVGAAHRHDAGGRAGRLRADGAAEGDEADASLVHRPSLPAVRAQGPSGGRPLDLRVTRPSWLPPG